MTISSLEFLISKKYQMQNIKLYYQNIDGFNIRFSILGCLFFRNSKLGIRNLAWLFRVVHRPGFAYHGYLHLPGIRHFILDLIGNIEAEHFRLLVVYLFALNDD